MREETLKKILLTGGALLTILFAMIPFTYMVATGLSTGADFLQQGQDYGFTLSNFATILFAESSHFVRYMINSIVISAIAAVISVFCAALGAYALTRFQVPGGAVLMLIILSISMFPPVSLVSYLFKFMTRLGWINTYQALILPYVAWTLPLSLWILVSYFKQVPLELDKAGLIDGASRLQILIKIILPVAAPGVFSTALLAFIFAFNEFLFALMLTTDFTARTIPVGIALFQGIHGQIPWGEIMAAATVTTIPVVVLTLIFQRRIISGLTRGAVKE
ncbi:MAG: carbohydrate ABC transporter permease [Thermodesulfobacteriota bacterium]